MGVQGAGVDGGEQRQQQHARRDRDAHVRGGRAGAGLGRCRLRFLGVPFFLPAPHTHTHTCPIRGCRVLLVWEGGVLLVHHSPRALLKSLYGVLALCLGGGLCIGRRRPKREAGRESRKVLAKSPGTDWEGGRHEGCYSSHWIHYNFCIFSERAGVTGVSHDYFLVHIS